MDFFEWKSEYEVGHEKIDFQHRNLVNMLNNLHEATTLDKESARVVMQVTLENLLQYTIFHFDTEETMMEESKYPDMENHKKEHVALKNRVTAFYQEFEQGKIEIPVLLEFLKNWLLNHIGKTDTKLSSYLAK